jgi:SNF2 family DNA or RNA helicase
MYSLRSYQKKIVDRFKDKSYGALFMGIGTGKTFTTISILKWRYENLGHKKILIVCPQSVINTWMNEINKFWPDVFTKPFGDTSSKRLKLLSEELLKDKFICIVNYECFTSQMYLTLCKVTYDVLILDESHLVKSHKSKRSKNLLTIRNKFKSCFILTASPITQNVTDLFMQFKIMDKGRTFGSNFFVFKCTYMQDKNEFWKGSPNYYPKWVVRKSMLEDLKQKMTTACEVVKTKDVLKELPPFIVKNYEVDLTLEQSKTYNNLKKELITEFNDTVITVENALTKILRLNQICAGHLDNTAFENTDKVDICVDLVQKILSQGEKVIIWTVFKQDITILTKALNKAKIYDILYITGEQTAQEKAEAENAFKGVTYNIMMINIQSGSTGLNLQSASHSINYSRNFSLIHALQSEGRNYRGGSEVHKTIVQHNIIVKNSVEEEIIKALQDKKALSEDIVSNIESIKKKDNEFKQHIFDLFKGDL